MNIIPMIKKEFKENTKNYKLLIVPIVFIIGTLMTPIMTLFLPEILKNSSELPAGAVLTMPEPQLSDMLKTFFTDIPQTTTIAIVLLIMGTIANERNSGVAAMVLVKPLSTTSYFLSKLLSNSVLILGSYFIGNLVSLYYCNVIKEGVNFYDGLMGILAVLPMLFLIVSISMFFSSFMKSALGIAGLSFVTTLLTLTVPQYLGKTITEYAPDTLIKNANNILMGTSVDNLAGPIIIALLASLILIVGGCFIFRKQEF